MLLSLFSFATEIFEFHMPVGKAMAQWTTVISLLKKQADGGGDEIILSKTIYPYCRSVVKKDELNFPIEPNATTPGLFASCLLLINFEKSHMN